MAMKERKAQAVAESENSGFRLEVTWVSAEDLEPVFVDNLHLALVNNQYYLTFGQLRLPMVFPDPPTKGRIHPVARFVIPREALQNIIALLRENVETKKP